MSSKLLVIIATGSEEKAVAGLMYARNAIKNRWLSMGDFYSLLSGFWGDNIHDMA